MIQCQSLDDVAEAGAKRRYGQEIDREPPPAHAGRIGDAADIVKRVVKRVKLHKLLCRLQLLGAAAVEKAAHVAAAHGAV